LSTAAADAGTARLFFALWPDGPARTQLAERARALHADCGGRMPAVPNLHMTLAFLGDTPLARLAELQALAARAQAPAFQLALDRLKWWRRSHIVWAGTAHCPAALYQLVSVLEDALHTGGFRYDAREFVAHVTLLRDARRGPDADRMPVIQWSVREFVLVRSLLLTGEYQIVARFPLDDCIGLQV